jgi:hypothetical protein
VLLTRSTVDGPTIALGDTRITPQARVLALHTPYGGLVWNRPSAVLVERDGMITRTPIVDLTRLIRVALWGCLLLGLVTTVQRKGA